MDQKELRELEARCIQEQAPPCQSGCPIHVDARTMLAQAAAGDLGGAARTFRKTVPFPGIISQVCDQPCQAACTRGVVGEPIAIRAVERACVEWGNGGEPVKPLPAREGRAAVVGGGLSGLTAAFDLAKKGWSVAVFEAADRLGGSVWALPEDVLPRTIIEADLGILDLPGLEVRLNAPVVDEGAFADLCTEFGAVYLGLGSEGETFGLARGAEGRIVIDPLTRETSQPGVFAGGGLLRGMEGRSAILSISDGRRAAVSIDRYLQGASLTASRQSEGPFPSLLYTSTVGIAPNGIVPMAEGAGYSAEEAIEEARRCIQCECLECVKVCEYLGHYGGYPRQHVRTVYNNLSIVMGERHANTFINSCALCGLCAEVCPNDVDFGAVCKEARQVMVEQERMPPSAHEFALRDMAFSGGEAFALARHAPGASTSEYLFFPGCQLAASRPEAVEQVYGYLLDGLGQKVGIMLGCCGAPADWAGRPDLLGETMTNIQARHAEMGYPTLVLACSSCTQVFRAELPDAEIVSLWELIEQIGLPEGAPPADWAVVSIHDPCSARYESAAQDSVRRIVGGLGYTINELPRSRERTTCCSYGGLMWFANRPLADEVIAGRVGEGEADYVTYCAVCRDFFAAQGKPTRHLLDLVFDGANGKAAGRGPTYSERHENRARLKRKLLREMWGEEMRPLEGDEAVRLRIDDEVLARLEERLILVEDIQAVIAHAERTGSRLLHKDSGNFLAHYRPAAVTYWVEYRPEGDEYAVLNAYSHRMEVAENIKP